MTRRTDRYPIRTTTAEEERRMAHCDQVHPAEAFTAIHSRRPRLVFGLFPDMTWRRVADIRSHRPPLGPLSYEIVFAPTPAHPHYDPYSRIFTPDGILLVESPRKEDPHARED